MNSRESAIQVVAEPPSEQVARKQITVLFCDMADYTFRSNSMDPEDLADEIRVFQALCTKVADKYHGNISNYLGDGVLVLFGHPHANEFDAEHAVRAGIEMIEEIEQNNESFEWRNKNPITIRIGIATSLVVVGEKAGKKRDQDELIIGEAPVLAARLQGIATPNTVVTSLRTRRLVGGAFKFKELGAQNLKGFSNPVPAWQLLHESTFQNRNYTSLKRVTTRFVSRHKELSFLSDSYEKAINGESIVIHLVGEAGIGKSRLLRVFEKTLKKQDIGRIRVTCSPYFDSTPLRSVIDEILRWLQINLDDSTTTKQSKIKYALLDVNISDDESYALFCELLFVDSPENIPALSISPEELHHRTLRFLADLLFSLSKIRPALLVVEDLHWSDPTTLELLDFIIRNALNHRLFAVFTSRPDFEPDWKQSNSLINLNLNRLDANGSAELVKAVFANTSLPRRVEQELVRKSDGVPLYLEECSWHILNKIQESDGEASVSDEFSVPDSLQDSLNARLDLLGKARELAQLCAAFGSFFTYSNIQYVAQLNGIDADNGIDILLQAGLLKTILNKDEDRYVFQHVLFQDAAYQSLLKKTRHLYHRQIAELFITEDPNIITNQPELVAYHYSRTEQLDTAVDLWIKASTIAISKSAISEARDHLDRGLNILLQLPDSREKKERELKLLLVLAVCLTVRSGYYGEQVTETYRRCIELASEVGDAEQLWSALYGFWRCLICQAEFGKAIKISVKLKRLCETLDDRKLYMTSLGIRAMTRMFGGKFLSAEKFYRNSVRLYDQIEDKNIGIRFGQDPYVTIQGMSAVNQLVRNNPKNSRLDMEKSVEIARSIDHPYTIAETLRLAAVHEHISRNMIGLKELAKEAIDISERFEFDGLLAASKIFLAFSNVITYREIHAIDIIRENLQRYKEKYALLLYPYFQGLLAESYLYMHNFQEAFTEANHVLLLIQKHGENWAQVPVMHIKAESAARGQLAGDSEIRQWYDEAEETAVQQNAELFLRRVILSRANYEQGKTSSTSKARTNNQLVAESYSFNRDSLNIVSANQYITQAT